STSKTPSYTKSVSWQHHRKSGGVKSPKKNNLLLFVRESMQQWRAFREYFNFQLNDKKLRKRSAYFSTNITSRKISHSKNNLKNHLLKCKYGA
ncbi:hypothetical protein, partial [Klebsiella pneumoniae]|uniref:hypothetical protein n=1 Tax=Klebsiella pneumoniae TaxID=573 RepID=UPI001CB6D62E